MAGAQEPAPGPTAAEVEAVRQRLDAVRRRIGSRTDRDVRVVCVTKGHPARLAAAVLAAGCGDLGENYAQELLSKQQDLPSDRCDGSVEPRWHFVGNVQSNKVRQLAGRVWLWHTIDRESLADELARRAPGASVLVQLDLAGLPDRGGCVPASAPGLVRRCVELGLDVRGLMGVGPPGGPEAARPGFRQLVAMADELGLPERSIGMSADLEVAVEEGATIVRVGTAVLGPRPPRPTRRGP